MHSGCIVSNTNGRNNNYLKILSRGAEQILVTTRFYLNSIKFDGQKFVQPLPVQPYVIVLKTAATYLEANSGLCMLYY